MLFSKVSYSGNGSQTLFTVPFPYISTTHVCVYLNGVLTTDYSWNNSTTISFNTAPAIGVAIVIQRQSAQSGRLVDYQDGSTLTESMLDTDVSQAFYVAQEAIDRANESINVNTADAYDANGKRFSNISPAIDPTDAVTKEYVDDLFVGGGASTYPSDKVQYKQVGAGAIDRTIRDKLVEFVSVKDFGAVGDGAVDDTAKIQAAINALSSAGGGTLYFPTGIYKITSALTVSSKAVRLVGESMYSTTLLKYGADCSSVIFNNAASDVCAVEQLRFAPEGSITQTSGFVISFTAVGSLGCRINRVLMEDVYSAIGCDMAPLSVNDVIISECELLRSKKYGIYMKGALNWMVSNSIVSMYDGSASTNALVLDGNTEGCFFRSVYFLGGQYTFRSIGNNKENRFTNVVFDGGSVSSAAVYDSASKRNTFIGCWCSTQATGGRGIVLDSTNVVGFSWINGEIVGIQQHGVVVTAASDFHIEGGRICNWGIQSAATYSGISIAANASMRFSIKNVTFAQDADLSGNSWNGVNVNAGTYGHYEISGCSGIGLTGALIADSGTCSTAQVINNPGYNPRGMQVIGAGASPYTYTAGHAPEMVCVTGGTVSAISVGGAGIYNSTDKTIHLAPNQSMVITHTVAPNLTISRQ